MAQAVLPNMTVTVHSQLASCETNAHFALLSEPKEQSVQPVGELQLALAGAVGQQASSTERTINNFFMPDLLSYKPFPHLMWCAREIKRDKLNL